MIKAGIIGATGYAGNEIVRLLLGHKDVEIKWFGSRSYIDQQYADIYQNFFKLVDAKCMDANMAALGEYWMGSAKAYSSVVLVTIGTGVGGGVILTVSQYADTMVLRQR